MKAADVIEALRVRHSPARGWVTAAEVPVSVQGAYSQLPSELLAHADQRIDLFAMSAFASSGFERIAYEVKVSRSDFRAEVADPDKSRGARLLAHRFMFACPAGLVRPEELPPASGLVEVGEGGRTRLVVPGPLRTPIDLPMPFIASLLRIAAEQRSMERRCGVKGCMRTVRGVRAVGGRRYGGPQVAVCGVHADSWDAAEKKAVA